MTVRFWDRTLLRIDQLGTNCSITTKKGEEFSFRISLSKLMPPDFKEYLKRAMAFRRWTDLSPKEQKIEIAGNHRAMKDIEKCLAYSRSLLDAQSCKAFFSPFSQFRTRERFVTHRNHGRKARNYPIH